MISSLNTSLDSKGKINMWCSSRVLGPLFFLIYINEINLSASEISFHLFADNTYLFYSNKAYGKLENVLNCSLDNIANWLRANKLTLNIKKSHLIAFDISKDDKGTAPIHIYVDESELEQKDCAKYLGVFFDKHLYWEKQTEFTKES